MSRMYVRHPDVRLTGIEGEGIVLHLGSRKYYSVSATGLDLLEWLIEPRSLEDLVQLLTDKYDVAVDEALRSTQDFLRQGLQDGVVRERDEP